MYRLYQANLNPRQDDNDKVVIDPLPATLYGDQYCENGIPLQVTIQPVGDDPSALEDGSALPYPRDFEELWRALEQEAIRNGWKHILPGQVEDGNSEDEVTEFGINSIPPVIIDPGYGRTGTNTEIFLREPRPSFDTSNNETPIRTNFSHWQTDQLTASEQPSGQIPRESTRECTATGRPTRDQLYTRTASRNRSNAPHGVRATDYLQFAAAPPIPESPRRACLNDDPGPQLAQGRRMVPPEPSHCGSAEDEAWQTLPSSLTELRAKYITAGIIKPNRTTPLGIKLKAARDGAVEIESIAGDGFLFLSGTPLKVGDQITCIKTSKASYACGHVGGMRKNEIVRLLTRAVGRLTIIVENPTGDPGRIECMTSKPHPEFGTGIFFLSGSNGAKVLQIHSVPINGLFSTSWLHRGAIVISINGVDCRELDACVATDIVKSAPRFVSIVAESSRTFSVDYSVNPAAHLRSVPEAEGSDRRSPLGIFRRQSSSSNCSRAVDC